MKKILGLDLGTSSIGWALVNEAENHQEKSRVLLNLNKKRGYRSSRKADRADEGTMVDGMSVAKELYENDLTPGQLVYRRILDDRFFERCFGR